MARFSDQCVVVTGGASGIGEATVRGIVAEGGTVVVADLQQDRGAALVEELGDASAFVATDVTSEADIVSAIELAQSRFGTLTGMVNNAGVVGAVGSIMETAVEDFDRTMAILSRAVFLGTKQAARVMAKNNKGAIVSLASTAGIMGGLGPHVYTMAKHGVVGLTKSAAAELSTHGVRVNAIAPGYVWTPLVERQIPDTMKARGLTEEQVKRDVLLAAQPTKEFVTVEQVAQLAMYLASDAASAITGTTMSIDGGWTAK